MISLDSLINILIVIWILAFITIIFFGVNYFNNANSMMAYLRKNKKDKVKKFSLISKDKPFTYSFHKSLPWINKNQNEIINPFKVTAYVYNKEDIDNQKIRNYKKNIRRAIKYILIIALLIILSMILPFLII